MSTVAYKKIIKRYMERTKKSKKLYDESRKIIPAGTSHPVSRYHKPYPFFAIRAKGSRIYDVDENEYLDLWASHAIMFIGHANPKVVKAVKEQAACGFHMGTYSELEVGLGKQVKKMIPCAEAVRFANSGTEANSFAIRVARAYTKKQKIGKFGGHYHGQGELYVYRYTPYDVHCAGMLEETVKSVIRLPWNDLQQCEKIIKEHENELAAVVLEPIPWFCAVPEGGFLSGLRELTEERGILLIFDEVVTGFRLAPGGAQEYYGVIPDLAVLSKILGGGLPIGAFAGREEIMNILHDPALNRPLSEEAYHGGSYSGNAMSMVAGLATLREIQDGSAQRHVNRLGGKLSNGLREIFEKLDVKAQVVGDASLYNVFVGLDKPPRNYEDCGIIPSRFKALEQKRMWKIEMMNRGIFWDGSHASYLMTVFTNKDITETLTAAEEAAKLVFRKHYG